MSHANARTTPLGRLLIVERAAAGWPLAHIAAAMGISRKCVRTWVARFQSEGVAGLVDRSSRPHVSPTRTSAEAVADVVAARRRLRCGPDGIASATGVPARTVSRVLAREGMPRLALLDRISGEVIRSSKQTAVRYGRDRPGELVHMDVKKLGRIPAGGGWRVHGRAAGSTSRDRATKVGFDYVHSLVDDHSRLAYSEVLDDERGTTCAGFFIRAAAYFADHGIPTIERLMTDNAWAYKQSLKGVCAQLGIRQKFIRPHCPWQNGKVERLNRTLATEWAYRQPWTDNDQRTAALAGWLEHYNTQRRHSALGGRPPTSRLTPT
ncbi:IS481 family transposase [Klenkia sp. PcliD-1-E]|uniref:IS481 family transposase n=1 Tax=Klenkia sp. PcliD-1-E TaxID=2954492 RepID=UPI00209798B9|nr:IS481 family transposase [Klenkia sp. PcliD-1-E]MCO7218381.1 IS481 family transposase [Klenkia sp. PcliD-1-E]